MRISERVIDYVTFIYLIIPILIFLGGWLRPIIAFPLGVILCIGLFVYLRKSGAELAPATRKLGGSFWVVALLAFAWVYFSGIGGYSNQDWDHHYRNAVFNDLVAFEWPMYFSFPSTYHIDYLAGHQATLNYYFTFWLPAALIGKVGGGIPCERLSVGMVVPWRYVSFSAIISDT